MLKYFVLLCTFVLIRLDYGKRILLFFNLIIFIIMDLVSKLWGFCNKLRHDGVDPSDYIEQLTYLLFLKMAEEKAVIVPQNYNRNSLIIHDDDSVHAHLDAIL